jgi:hypothetical protein
MQFSQLAQFFPLVLAPGVIAMVRRQKRLAWLDGPVRVWAAVVGAAVLWTLLLALAYEEPITRSTVARGVLMGLTAALADTWATRKAKAQEEPPPAQEQASPAVADDRSTEVVAPPLTPENTGTRREMDLDWKDSPSSGVRG